jgi:hypothetical protein
LSYAQPSTYFDGGGGGGGGGGGATAAAADGDDDDDPRLAERVHAVEDGVSVQYGLQMACFLLVPILLLLLLERGFAGMFKTLVDLIVRMGFVFYAFMSGVQAYFVAGVLLFGNPS